MLSKFDEKLKAIASMISSKSLKSFLGIKPIYILNESGRGFVPSFVKINKVSKK